MTAPTPAASDCGDNSCRYAPSPRTGQRTNGGCRCAKNDPALALAETFERWALTAIEGRDGLVPWDVRIRLALRMAERIDAAVLAERERAAKICDEFDWSGRPGDIYDLERAAEILAEAIRRAP